MGFDRSNLNLVFSEHSRSQGYLRLCGHLPFLILNLMRENAFLLVLATFCSHVCEIYKNLGNVLMTVGHLLEVSTWLDDTCMALPVNIWQCMKDRLCLLHSNKYFFLFFCYSDINIAFTFCIGRIHGFGEKF